MVRILDTAGQEEYSAMRDQYMRTGEGFLIFYNITSRESFEGVSVIRDQILRVKDNDSCSMILVGAGVEHENNRVVSKEEGAGLAKLFGCPFMEGSAKQRLNVDESFHQLIREIRRDNANSALRFTSQKKKTPSNSISKTFQNLLKVSKTGLDKF